MNGQELLEHLQNLSPEALARPVVFPIDGNLYEIDEPEAPEGTREYFTIDPAGPAHSEVIIIS